MIPKVEGRAYRGGKGPRIECSAPVQPGEEKAPGRRKEQQEGIGSQPRTVSSEGT